MKRLILVVACLCLSKWAWCDAITRDSTASAATDATSPVTWTHVVSASCTNPMLIVFCGIDKQAITGITYNSVAIFTQAVAQTSSEYCYIYYSTWPATGSHSIAVTLASTAHNECVSLSLCNVSIYTPIDSTATGDSSTTNPFLNVTVASSGAWTYDGIYENGTAIVTVPLSLYRRELSGYIAGDPEAIATELGGSFASGSNTVGYNGFISADWAKCAISITPSSGTAIVISGGVTVLTGTTATGNGTLLNPNGYPQTALGCVVNTAGNPTTGDNVFAAGNEGAYTCSITGLSANTLYHMRAYATNSQGTVYGADVPFYTLSRIHSIGWRE